MDETNDRCLLIAPRALILDYFYDAVPGGCAAGKTVPCSAQGKREGPEGRAFTTFFTNARARPTRPRRALNHASLTHIQLGAYAAAHAETDELAALADEKDAIHTITTGVTALRSTGATLWMPSLLTHLAGGTRPIREENSARTITALARVLIEIVGAEHRTGNDLLIVAGAILVLSFAVLLLRFASPGTIRPTSAVTDPRQTG
jgi:hypothetical protein